MAKHLTTQQVAAIFHVHPNTVVAWAKAGKLPYTRTPGRHRRFDPVDVESLRVKTEQQGDAA
jgi:excisionase family DNA binding protein